VTEYRLLRDCYAVQVRACVSVQVCVQVRAGVCAGACAAVCAGVCAGACAAVCAGVELLFCVQVRACVQVRVQLCSCVCRCLCRCVLVCRCVCCCVYKCVHVQVRMQLCVQVRACAAVQTLEWCVLRLDLLSQTRVRVCSVFVSCMCAHSILSWREAHHNTQAHYPRTLLPSIHSLCPRTQETAGDLGTHVGWRTWRGEPSSSPHVSRAVSHSPQPRDPSLVCCIQFSHQTPQ
jgi:hypothetical protein